MPVHYASFWSILDVYASIFLSSLVSSKRFAPSIPYFASRRRARIFSGSGLNGARTTCSRSEDGSAILLRLSSHGEALFLTDFPIHYSLSHWKKSITHLPVTALFPYHVT